MTHPFINSGGFAWNSAGITTLYPRPWTLVAGTYYAMGSGTTQVSGQVWKSVGLYTSTKPLTGWTVPATAIISAVANTWIDHYLLHSVFAPAGCSQGNFCVFLSAMNNASGDTIGLFSASTITGPYTAYSGNPVLSNVAQCNGVGLPMLPSIVQIGTTYYMYTALHDNTGTFLVYWTSPANDGVNWTCRGPMFRTVNSTDWDFTNFGGIIDPHVWLNSHGFYEMFYTAEHGSPVGQNVGYMISPNGTTWYKYTLNAVITPGTFCDGLAFVGDANEFEGSGTFQAFYDCSDGTTVSYVNSSTMTDH